MVEDDLSVSELKQVKAITDNKLQMVNNSPVDVSFESFLYIVIDEVHKRRTGTSLMPFFTYKKKAKSVKNFTLYTSLIEAWLSDVIKLNKKSGIIGYKKKLLVMLIEIMMDDIERRSLPLKTDIIMNALVGAPDLFNAAYPGYITSGLINKLLMKLK